MSRSDGQTFRLELEYDGGRFRGWQVQPSQRTVQGELETGLGRILDAPTRVIAAGRTDAGAHAFGQVVSFRGSASWSSEDLVRALNGVLPDDVVVRRGNRAEEDFNARRDAVNRSYVYCICFSQRVISRGYEWWLRDSLDENAMQAAFASLEGERDFTSFCVAASEHENRHCRVLETQLLVSGDRLQLRVSANRFLRGMVRGIVGTLVEIGRGRREPREILEILDAKDRGACGQNAPACGLFLEKVAYPDGFVSGGSASWGGLIPSCD